MSQCNFFWASCSNHCSAALGLGAGVEQPFDCLIIQNRQAVQSMGRSMDWTLEDNMVDGLFFCPHSQVAEKAIPHLYKQERKRPTAVRRRLSRTRAVLGRVIPGGWVPVSGIKVRSLVRLSNHSAFHPWSAQCAARMLLLSLSDKMMGCCAVGTNVCLNLRRRAFALGGQVSAGWSRFPSSMARRARDSVVLCDEA